MNLKKAVEIALAIETGYIYNFLDAGVAVLKILGGNLQTCFGNKCFWKS